MQIFHCSTYIYYYYYNRNHLLLMIFFSLLANDTKYSLIYILYTNDTEGTTKH